VSCEKGKCFMTESPESVTAGKFKEIIEKIKNEK
jgi:hypothetical protein